MFYLCVQAALSQCVEKHFMAVRAAHEAISLIHLQLKNKPGFIRNWISIYMRNMQRSEVALTSVLNQLVSQNG